MAGTFFFTEEWSPKFEPTIQFENHPPDVNRNSPQKNRASMEMQNAERKPRTEHACFLFLKPLLGKIGSQFSGKKMGQENWMSRKLEVKKGKNSRKLRVKKVKKSRKLNVNQLI